MTDRQEARASATADTSGDQAEFTIRLPNIGRLLGDIFPEEFRTHMRAARREQLLAVRSLIDAALDRMDKPTEESKSRGRSHVEIAVE